MIISKNTDTADAGAQSRLRAELASRQRAQARLRPCRTSFPHDREIIGACSVPPGHSPPPETTAKPAHPRF